MTKRNPIIEAGDRLDEADDGVTELNTEAFDMDADEFTDEDVAESMTQLEERQLAGIRASRTAGRAPRTSAAARETPAQTAKRGRAHEMVWKPADALDAPPARPGMDQRWVRYALGDREDPRNWMRKQREGWVPRSLDTVSDEYQPPTVTLKQGGIGKVIGVPGLILCERPIEISRARTKFMRAKLARQLAAASTNAINKVQRGDHPIDVSLPREAPTVGRGRRRASYQDGNE